MAPSEGAFACPGGGIALASFDFSANLVTASAGTRRLMFYTHARTRSAARAEHHEPLIVSKLAGESAGYPIVGP